MAGAIQAFQTALPDITGRFGITNLRPKRSITGNMLILISGEGRVDKAEALSGWMQEHLKEHDLGVRVK